MSATRIALDVMGGDDAPGALLGGAVRAVAAGMDPGRIVLVGDEGRIRSFLLENGGDPGFGILASTQVIEMGDSPAQALRAKPNSSVCVAVGAVRSGQAGAVVSMGNTGACVGASTLGMGTLEGVRRPGIAVTLELTGKPLTLMDMGANIAPKPAHLAQYAAMGSVYSKACLGIAAPRVGLLNVGEEAGKGTQVLKEAYPLLEQAPIDFIGNVEGSDLFQEACDVVITDGFTGNVVLKLLEHFAGFMLGMMLEELDSHKALDWGRDALSNMRRSIDYSHYGGALLLGVNGVVVIGHGRSDESAVANALGLAARALDSEVNREIERGLSLS